MTFNRVVRSRMSQIILWWLSGYHRCLAPPGHGFESRVWSVCVELACSLCACWVSPRFEDLQVSLIGIPKSPVVWGSIFVFYFKYVMHWSGLGLHFVLACLGLCPDLVSTDTWPVLSWAGYTLVSVMTWSRFRCSSCLNNYVTCSREKVTVG